MLDTGVDERALGVFSPAFVPSDSRWTTTPSAEDGACVGGGACVDGELLDEATLDARESELTRLSAHLDAATHRQLTLIRLMDVAGRWAQQGAKSCAAWLSWKIGLAPGPAREHVRVARALAALPQIDDALRRGAISYSKVRAMTRVATPANEQKLLDAALETTAAQLEKICRGLRHVQRADGRQTEDDSPERFVRLRYRGDGTVSVEAVLLPDEAHRVMDALRLVRAAMSEEQDSDLEGAQPELADALTRIAEDILAGDVPANNGPANDSPAHDSPANDGLGPASETDPRFLGSDVSSTSSDADPRSRGSDGTPLDSTPSDTDPRYLGSDSTPLDSTGDADPRSRGSDGTPLDSTSRDAGSRYLGSDGTPLDSTGDADPRYLGNDHAPRDESTPTNADPRYLGNDGTPLDESAPTNADPRSSGNADTPLDESTPTNADPRYLGNDDAPLDESTLTNADPRSSGSADTRRDSTSEPGPRSPGNAARRHHSAHSSGAERTQVIVHFTEDRIDGGHAAFLDDGFRVAPETFRRLACDCGLIGVREDHDGDPLDVGRKTRTIPPALRRAVMLRDEHCQFPGCTHDRHIDLHHIIHWVHGGPTSKQNLIALCTFHHTLVHEGGFTLERSADGVRFLAPDRAAPLPRFPLPAFYVPPPAPTDPLEAFERAHADLRIHDETGLTGWDGERVHYSDVVEVLAAADEPGADQPSAEHPGDLDLPVRTWLAKHGLDA